MNICIIHYNTPYLTECLIKSINKFSPNCHIYIFDNSDKFPFTYHQDNLTVLDNTRGEFINFDKWLENFPDKYKGEINNWASAKHAYSVDKCMEIINEPFILLDSDILLKRDISQIPDDEYVFVGEIETRKDWKDRCCPYICYINTNICKEKNIHFFTSKTHGLTKEGYRYDTGSSFYEQIIDKNLPIKQIDIDNYMIHYKAGSWNNVWIKDRISPEEWIRNNEYLYEEKIIITMTSWSKRINNIPLILDSIYKQTKKADKIIINLSTEEFPEKEKSLPENIIKYIQVEDNIEIFWLKENIKQWKKIYPTLTRYPKDCIINIDDDFEYPSDMIETLYNCHIDHPDNNISGNRIYKHGYKCACGCASLIKYDLMKAIDQCMDDKVFDFYSDDMFFTYIAQKSGHPYIYCGKDFFTGSMNKINEIDPLRETVSEDNNVDTMWNYMISKYGSMAEDPHGISICITSYNSAKYIKETLDSIYKQTWFVDHDNYEVIIGVDGDYDDAVYIQTLMRNYKNLRVILMNNNQGTYITSNTVMSLAKYDWVLRFDSDDIMADNCINTVMNNLSNHDFIRWKMQNFGLKKNIQYAFGQHAIRKSIFMKFGGYQPWRCSGDSEIIARICPVVKTIILEDILNFRRVHGESLTQKPGELCNVVGSKGSVRQKLLNIVRELDSNPPKNQEDATIRFVIERYSELHPNDDLNWYKYNTIDKSMPSKYISVSKPTPKPTPYSIEGWEGPINEPKYTSLSIPKTKLIFTVNLNENIPDITPKTGYDYICFSDHYFKKEGWQVVVTDKLKLTSDKEWMKMNIKYHPKQYITKNYQQIMYVDQELPENYIYYFDDIFGYKLGIIGNNFLYDHDYQKYLDKVWVKICSHTDREKEILSQVTDEKVKIYK